MLEIINNLLAYLLILIKEANLLTLFFFLVIGVVFAPINRESIVVFMAVVAAANAINPIVAFVITTGATFLGYNLGFIIGRGFQKRFEDWLENSKGNTKKKINRSYELLEKYDTWAIIVSYFVPGARHFLPAILGIGTMTWTKFLTTSMVGSVIWTAAFYVPSYFFGEVWTTYFVR